MLLFAVILSAIILAISLGVSNITFRELTFSTSAQATNDAFYAADVGAECALYYDLNRIFAGDSNGLVFAFGYPGIQVYTPCAANSGGVNLNNGQGSPQPPPWEFTLLSLGTSGRSCVIVTVEKNGTSPNFSTRIISRGYSTGGNADCDTNEPNRVERVIEVNY